MKKTTNYEFNLPESSDLYNVEDFNSNFSNVDEKLKEVDTPTYVVASDIAELSSGENLRAAFGKIAKAISSLISHLTDTVGHITSAERTTWNSKANGTHTHTKSQISDFPTSMTPTAHNHSASEITSGTLPVARGGTGATTFTSGQALIGNGTGAVTTRAITNSTATTTAITASTNLVTMNTLKNAMNRTTGIGTADTNYGTSMVRAISAGTSDLTAGSSTLLSGAIYIVYE